MNALALLVGIGLALAFVITIFKYVGFWGLVLLVLAWLFGAKSR